MNVKNDNSNFGKIPLHILLNAQIMTRVIYFSCTVIIEVWYGVTQGDGDNKALLLLVIGKGETSLVLFTSLLQVQFTRPTLKFNLHLNFSFFFSRKLM